MVKAHTFEGGFHEVGMELEHLPTIAEQRTEFETRVDSRTYWDRSG